MMKSAISFAMRWLQALARSRRGATAVEYVMVAGLVGAVALPAFAQFDTTTLTAVQDRSSLVAHLGGEATGPVDSLGGEIAGATVNNAVGAAKDGTALLDIAPFLPFGGSKKKSHGEGEDPHATPGIEHAAPDPFREPEPGEPAPHGEAPTASKEPAPHGEAPTGSKEPAPHGEDPTASTEPAPHGEDPIAFNEPPSRQPPSGPEGRCSNGACKPGNPTGCFVAGTPVLTPGGLKAIEQIQPDDEVVSRDEETGEVSVRHVVQTFVRLNAAVVRVETLDPGDRPVAVEATPGHLFWTAGGWVRADELTRGELLLDAHDGIVRVVHVEAESATATVYNFEVDVTHTYFVGEDAVWVHNMDPGPSSSQASSSASEASASTQTQVERQHAATDIWRTERPANGNGYRQVSLPVGNGDLHIACLGNDCVIVDLGLNQAGGRANSKGHPYVNEETKKLDIDELAKDVARFIGTANNVNIVFTHADDDHASLKVVEALLAPSKNASDQAKARAGTFAAKVKQIYFGANYDDYNAKVKQAITEAAVKGGTKFGITTGKKDSPIAITNHSEPLDPTCSGHCLSLNFLSNKAANDPNDGGLVVAVGIVDRTPANDNGVPVDDHGMTPANDNGSTASAPGESSRTPAANDNGGRVFTAVFTGDAGEQSLKKASEVLGPGATVHVLDWPHHGSNNPTHFVGKHAPNIVPLVVTISASSGRYRKPNNYAFPRPEAINAALAVTTGEVPEHSIVSRVPDTSAADKIDKTTKALFFTGEAPVEIRHTPGKKAGSLTVMYGHDGGMVVHAVTVPAAEGTTREPDAMSLDSSEGGGEGPGTPPAREPSPDDHPMGGTSPGGGEGPGTPPAREPSPDDHPMGGQSQGSSGQKRPSSVVYSDRPAKKCK